MLGDDVEYELLQCARDPKNKTSVAFTIGMKSENGVELHFAPHQLSLTDKVTFTNVKVSAKK